MKKIAVMMFMGLWVLLSVHTCWAEKAYVVNSSKITLRGGPSTKDKIITMLKQDSAVEILETQTGWSHVRLLGNTSRNYEGWIVSGFLTREVPWKVQAKGFKEENVRLKQRAENIENEWSASSGEKELMSEKLEKAEKELKSVKTKYESLKKASGSLLELQESHEKTLKESQEARVILETLQKENMILKSSQRNRWFLTGAVVLLVGLIFGLVMGRQQRKKKSSYY
ncbi:MAG: TIGR04211 family SH3 domain-containing protein [Deltaproteobacteria bacterium]|nr:TIGR04211 family SH3 domain-containing protein [Deltaproteobacteria bacterium]